MPRSISKKPVLARIGRERVVIESVAPNIDGGRFPIKRVRGDEVIIEADVFADGHDVVAGTLCVRKGGARTWIESRMVALGNDRFRGTFVVSELGLYGYTVRGHIDRFASFCLELSRRPLEDPDLGSAFAYGATLIAEAAECADRGGVEVDAKALREAARLLRSNGTVSAKRAVALDSVLAERVYRFADRRHEATFERELMVSVDPERARSSAWYEFFPRSFGPRQRAFKGADAMLAYIAGMGFDVVYLPPVSPIGEHLRKGPNNSQTAAPADVGSPWAIGSVRGGHKAIAPELGTLADFRDFCKKAASYRLEVALDIAFQCAPDHPYVHEHPEWFRHRPDGTIQYAENPPKKYQDIYPLDFETEDWEALWQELRDVLLFWIEQGIRLFRVDNPHTKAFPFWEWVIAEVKNRHPDVLFLAEAFTRPKVMHRLAKLGFSYSYTYFTWRNAKHELTEYFTELTRGPGREYFRPHVWPNTPDILPAHLQYAPRSAFEARLVLAATLCANYGIYGPAFELMENIPRSAESEEYQDSEKYQLRTWATDRDDSLRDLVALVNRIRRENRALQDDRGLEFHAIDNDKLICYSKATSDGESVILVVVNLDPYHRQSGWLSWTADRAAGSYEQPVQMHDLLSEARYLWSGGRHFIELSPERIPAHIFRVRRHTSSENNFDYYC